MDVLNAEASLTEKEAKRASLAAMLSIMFDAILGDDEDECEPTDRARRTFAVSKISDNMSDKLAMIKKRLAFV